jgi:hypothetical protein
MTVVLVRDGRDITTWPLDLDGRRGLEVVDDLARLQLRARRLGCSIRIDGGFAEVVALLDLAGLRSVVEVRGEPEGGEERGVEEVVLPDDPVA